MDPVSAISLAAGVLAFIEFSWKLVSGTYEMRCAVGVVVADDARITAVIADLRDVSDGLETNISARSPHETALQTLAAECVKLSRELLEILSELKVAGHNSTWKNLKSTWLRMKARDDIQRLETRLGDYRSQILTRLILIMRYDLADSEIVVWTTQLTRQEAMVNLRSSTKCAT